MGALSKGICIRIWILYLKKSNIYCPRMTYPTHLHLYHYIVWLTTRYNKYKLITPRTFMLTLLFTFAIVSYFIYFTVSFSTSIYISHKGFRFFNKAHKFPPKKKKTENKAHNLLLSNQLNIE